MGLRPTFEILSNDKDITAQISQHLISLSITDELEDRSDSFTMRLSDIEIPEDVELKIFLGWDDVNSYIGSFIVSDVEISLKEPVLTISGKAANLHGKIKQVKRRSFENTSLEGIVSKVAEENNLGIKYTFDSIPIIYIGQKEESDLSFLNRLARQYGAIFSIKNNTVIFIDEADTIIDIEEKEITSGSIKLTGKEYKSVSAVYRDRKKNAEFKVSAGSGEPCFKLSGTYPNKWFALGNAKRKLLKLRQTHKSGSISLPGRTDIYAGSKVRLSGFRKEALNVEYLVKKTTYSFTSKGFITTINI